MHGLLFWIILTVFGPDEWKRTCFKADARRSLNVNDPIDAEIPSGVFESLFQGGVFAKLRLQNTCFILKIIIDQTKIFYLYKCLENLV